MITFSSFWIISFPFFFASFRSFCSNKIKSLIKLGLNTISWDGYDNSNSSIKSIIIGLKKD